MSSLDTAEVYNKFDPSNMIGRISELPQQCKKAWQSALDIPLPSDYCNVDQVIILGMGGSAIGGDMVQTMTLEKSNISVLVNRDYNLPKSVDDHTLVIASSYSGNTEETLSAFSQAIPTPAKKLAITTGGRLQAFSVEKGIPVYTFHYDAEPRAAFGYSFFSLLAIFRKLGFLALDENEVDETITVLEKLTNEFDKGASLRVNQAKQLATRLWGHLVVIYGAGTLSKVAYRWKTQLNECSKVWAFAEYFPELNHNAVVGYRFPSWLNHKTFVVMLYSSSLHSRILSRYEATGELLKDAGVTYELVEAKGNSPLSQMMSSVILGDYVSYYLALLNNVDPSPVAAIDFLKGRLTEAETN
jgi:glucose/mannose-6-phosphate isomerase